jgi:hypothetical protein
MPCAKCGTRNPDGVEECLYCGMDLRPTAGTQPAGLETRVPLTRRLVASLVVGLLVLLLSLGVAYQQYCNSFARIRQKSTLATIGRVQRAVKAYHQARHAFPETLQHLPAAGNADFHRDRTDTPVDYWRQPLHYWTDGTHYRVTSYGRDGKPGGVGFDYDLSAGDSRTAQMAPTDWWHVMLPEQSRPTFGQFLTDTGRRPEDRNGGAVDSTGMVLTCLLASMAGFGVTLSQTRRRVRTRSLLKTLVGTLVVAVFMALCERPSGH